MAIVSMEERSDHGHGQQARVAAGIFAYLTNTRYFFGGISLSPLGPVSSRFGMDEHRRVTMKQDGDHVLVYPILNDLPPIDRERGIKASQDLARFMWRKLAGMEIANGEGARVFRIPDLGERRLQAFAKRMEEGINKVLFAPLTPNAVDRALDITPRERLRWYKDGRLPTCGRATVDRGNRRIQFPLFPFEKVACIQANPELIAAWRNQDACTHSGLT